MMINVYALMKNSEFLVRKLTVDQEEAQKWIKEGAGYSYKILELYIPPQVQE